MSGAEHVREAIEVALSGSDVPADRLEAAFGQIMDGEADPVQIAALLVALRAKGESVEEIVATEAIPHLWVLPYVIGLKFRDGTSTRFVVSPFERDRWLDAIDAARAERTLAQSS